MRTLVGLISIFVMIVAWASEPRVSILEKPLVQETGAIYLRDIAQFDNVPSQWLDGLGKVKVASSKEQFYKMTPTRFMGAIRNAVKRFERDCSCHIQLNIPRSLLLYSMNGKFTLDKAREKILNILDTSCVDCEYRLKGFKAIKGQIPESYKHWTIDSGVSNLKGASYINVYFDDNVLNPLVISTNILVYKKVLKAKDTILRGEELGAHQFSYEKINITNNKRAFAHFKDLEGAELKRTLSSKQIVYLDDLVAPNLARYGQPVQIEFLNSSISLEMSGIAKKNGKKGELIPVLVEKTKKRLMAEVIGDGKVRVTR